MKKNSIQKSYLTPSVRTVSFMIERGYEDSIHVEQSPEPESESGTQQLVNQTGNGAWQVFE